MATKVIVVVFFDGETGKRYSIERLKKRQV